MRLPVIASLVLAVIVLGGCRGMHKESAPIHLNPNMDDQPMYKAMGGSDFFDDGRAMRPPVPGTVARGMLREESDRYYGRTAAGGYVTSNPVPISMEMLERGRNRYNIYCSVCHSASGDGQGIIMTGQYGYTPAPSFHDERLINSEDGYLYEVITYGVRNMPAYGHQVDVDDRWAIVAYVRALQRSQNASMADIPEAQRASLTQAEMPPASEAETESDDTSEDTTATE